MNKKLILNTIIAALLLVYGSYASAQEFNLGGYVRNITGVVIDDERTFSQVQNTFNLKAEYYSDMSELKAEVYINQSDTEDIVIGIKEMYIDLYFNALDLRVGKQQIIWGKSDGVFITDIISPKDLSNFILSDFDEIRLGVTALKAVFFTNTLDFEFVWIPIFTPAVTPGTGTIWEVSTPLPGPLAITEPSDTLENSEVFGRVSFMGSEIDIELMAGYMWDDLPSAYEDGSIVADYNRVTMAGGSFSMDIHGLIVRAEGAYYNGKFFTILSSPLSTIEKDFVNYMVGLDYSIGGFTFGTQFIQEIVLDYDEKIMLNSEYKNTMTLAVARPFLNETLIVEFFSYVGLNNKDALLRPKITYNITDGLEWSVGADVFLGNKGDFGQFNDNDLLYSRIKYSF